MSIGFVRIIQPIGTWAPHIPCELDATGDEVAFQHLGTAIECLLRVDGLTPVTLASTSAHPRLGRRLSRVTGLRGEAA